MRTRTPFPSKLATLAGVLLLLLASACSDEASGTSPDVEPDIQDGGEDSSPDPGPDEEPVVPVTLTLRIQSHNLDYCTAPDWRGPAARLPHIPFVDLALRDVAAELEPVADVRVALETPDGTFLGEADSDADGLVVFEVPTADWPENIAVSATAYKFGYLLHTLTDIARPSSAEPVPLTISRRAQDPLEMVRVRGLANRSSASNNLAINVLAPCGGFFGGFSNAWEIETPAGVAFDLIATEYRFSFQSNWNYDGQFIQRARVSSDAVWEDTVLDIDFAADAVESIEVEGSYRLPERNDSPLRELAAYSQQAVFAAGSYYQGVTGFSTKLRLNGDTVSYTVEVVETPEYGGNWYHYRVQAWGMDPFNAGPISYAYGRGLPVGPQAQLLDLPEWVGESESGQGHPIDEPLSWEIFDEAVSQYIWVSTGEEVVWVVEVPGDATSANLPAPPSGVDLFELGDSPRAMIALERQIDSDDGVFWLESWGSELELDLGDEPEPTGQLPTAEDWMAHLVDEVMPFWMVDDALGDPEGNFPTFRCDDGTLPDPDDNRCPELYNTGWIASEMGRHYMRMLSRQTYLYGVAYHLTGDERYFELHLAGVEQLRTRGLDPAGGAYTYYEGETPGPASAERTSQDLSYAVLGLAMNVYLTRDPDVLQDVLDLKDFIFDEYWDDELGNGMLRWTRSNAGGERELVAQLDQINAYMLLLARLLPESEQSAWNADIDRLVDVLVTDYYWEDENLFWGTLDEPTFGGRHVDFGHTIKSFWMIYLEGRLDGDSEQEAWAAERMPDVFEWAYQTTAGPYEGLWAASPGWVGTEWWSYVELNQAAATLALEDPAMLDYLETTYAGYFDRMVDDEHGGIYHEVSGLDTVSNAKAHQWKNGFHELEHILVGYLTGQALADEPAELWFAFDDDAYNTIAVPYYYEAVETERTEQAFETVTGFTPTVVTFEDLE